MFTVSEQLSVPDHYDVNYNPSSLGVPTKGMLKNEKSEWFVFNYVSYKMKSTSFSIIAAGCLCR